MGYSASNLVEMKPMHNEDWFAMNNDNMENEWRPLCSIDLDFDLKHHIDLNETQHDSDLMKPKTMHNVKINDWFTMNNDNNDIEWRRLNMINLEYDHDNDLEEDSDITTLEWNRLNMIMIYPDTIDPYLNQIPEQ